METDPIELFLSQPPIPPEVLQRMHAERVIERAKDLSREEAFHDGRAIACREQIDQLFRKAGIANTPDEILGYRPLGFSLAELEASPPPVVGWVVDLLIQALGITGLIGRPKIGKSFLLLLLALCIGGGVDFLGRKVSRGRVLYIDEEMGRPTLWSRWLRIRAAHPAFWDPETLSRVHFVALGGLSIERPDEIRREIEKAQPTLLIVDSFRRVYTGKENDSDQVAKAMAFFGAIRTEYQIAEVIAHHTRKNLEGSEFWEDAARGSSDFFAACDGLLGLGKRARGLGELRATLRSAPEPDPINLVLDEQTTAWQVTSLQAEPVVGFDSFKAIEEILLSKPGTAWPQKLVAQALQTEFGRSERMAEKAVWKIHLATDGQPPLGVRLFKRPIPGTRNEREIVLLAP